MISSRLFPQTLESSWRATQNNLQLFPEYSSWRGRKLIAMCKNQLSASLILYLMGFSVLVLFYATRYMPVFILKVPLSFSLPAWYMETLVNKLKKKNPWMNAWRNRTNADASMQDTVELVHHKLLSLWWCHSDWFYSSRHIVRILVLNSFFCRLQISCRRMYLTVRSSPASQCPHYHTR